MNGFEKDLIPNDDKFNYKQFIDKEKSKTNIFDSLSNNKRNNKGIKIKI